MGIIDKFIPPGDRRAALLLYGLIVAISFNGYDSGIMTVILADEQFTKYCVFLHTAFDLWVD
jgi:hypothetical protein